MSVLGIPGEVHEQLGLDLVDDLTAVEQVGLVPADPESVGATPPGDGVHLVSGAGQRDERVAPDEAACAGEQHPAQGRKSG